MSGEGRRNPSPGSLHVNGRQPASHTNHSFCDRPTWCLVKPTAENSKFFPPKLSLSTKVRGGLDMILILTESFFKFTEKLA